MFGCQIVLFTTRQNVAFVGERFSSNRDLKDYDIEYFLKIRVTVMDLSFR